MWSAGRFETLGTIEGWARLVDLDLDLDLGFISGVGVTVAVGSKTDGGVMDLRAGLPVFEGS